MKFKANITGDVPTKNGRIYPTEVLKRAIEVFNETKVKNKVALGTLGAKDDITIHLSDVAFLVESIDLNTDNEIELDIKILATPHGLVLKDMLPYISITPIGVGTLGKNNTVQDDYVISYFDAFIP